MRLIDADILLDEICRDQCERKYKDCDGTCELAAYVVNAPTIVPAKEYPKRVIWTGWKGYRDTRYKCPNCQKPVKNDDVYCHRCGQKLLFPRISFTPYVEGQIQQLIVRWDDETN